MPGRQYRQQGLSSLQSTAQNSASRPTSRKSSKKNSSKTAKRVLDAFSIAQHTTAPDYRPNKARLGEIDNAGTNGKRARDEDEEEGDSEDNDSDAGRSRKKLRRGDKLADGREVDGGSDSEGNEWVVGAVPEDEDSEIESEDAFGESDEEEGRFEGFAFGGKAKKAKGKTIRREVGEKDLLDEREEREMDSGEESDGFAAEAVDLADMLDQGSEDESSVEDGSNEDVDLAGSDEEDDVDDPAKLSAMQNLLASLDADQSKKRSEKDVAQEAATPGVYGLNPKQKLSIADSLALFDDPILRKSLKILADDGKKSKSTGIPGKLSAPLPKRQQDRIDRTAAKEKSIETLNRWIDTVKHNRRAEHLVFPMVDHNVEAAKNMKGLTLASKPSNDLENTIQKILVDSGLGPGTTQDEEVLKSEELATNAMPIEEVRARQAELRRARDLLFREEIRAKRIKKIKSKAYRRVHRKERERDAERERTALRDAGIVPSDDEQERMDRRRAEARMGQRHRESRWAKGVKDTGRAAWDNDARDGVAAMLRQDEELKQRIHGRDVEESSQSESEASDEDEEAFTARMQGRISKLGRSEAQSESNLSSMKFMKKAEAARRAQNDEAIEQLQRELDGASEPDSDREAPTGRRKFGPQSKIKTAIQPREQKGEFEEGHDSDQDRPDPDQSQIAAVTSKLANSSTKSTSTKSDMKKQNGFSAQPEKKTVAKVASKTNSTPAPGTRKTKKPVQLDTAEDSEVNETFGGLSPQKPAPISNEDVIAMAFAADDVFTTKSFDAEKKLLADDEEPETIVSGGLAGWGSWAGPGLTKREKRNAKAIREQSTIKKKGADGVTADKRQDRKLDRVIISEKSVPKTAKYLASSLPFPYENRAQYERSLRLPMGPEFTTKTTFQNMTKPRVIMKGGIIAPMRKPLM